MKVPQKIKILRFIAEQGIVTVNDVQRFLGNRCSLNSMRVALYKLGLGRMQFPNVRHGVWYIKNQEQLDLLKIYYWDFPDISLKEVYLHQVPHALGMNQIRIALEQTDEIDIVEWWSESYIRALHPGMRHGFGTQRYPDAIFWRKRKDGTRQKYFVEYERSLKNRARYMRIFEFYANHEEVMNKNVIYICGNEVIVKELMKTEQMLVKSGKIEAVGHCFQFMTFDNFCKRYSPRERYMV